MDTYSVEPDENGGFQIVERDMHGERKNILWGFRTEADALALLGDRIAFDAARKSGRLP